MTDSTLTHDQCAAHAKDCRGMAQKEANSETRKSLKDLAASWEQLCEELAEIEKRKKQ